MVLTTGTACDGGAKGGRRAHADLTSAPGPGVYNCPAAQRPSGPAAQRPSGPAAQRPSGPAAQRPSGPAAQRPSGPAAQRPPYCRVRKSPARARPDRAEPRAPHGGGPGPRRYRGGDAFRAAGPGADRPDGGSPAGSTSPAGLAPGRASGCCSSRPPDGRHLDQHLDLQQLRAGAGGDEHAPGGLQRPVPRAHLHADGGRAGQHRTAPAGALHGERRACPSTGWAGRRSPTTTPTSTTGAGTSRAGIRTRQGTVHTLLGAGPASNFQRYEACVRIFG